MSNLSRLMYIGASLAAVVIAVVVTRMILRPGEQAPPPAPSSAQLPPLLPADLVARQRTPERPPDEKRYPQVNDRSAIMNIRRPGHRYVTEVVAQMSGTGSHKDWGLKGAAKFRLTWKLGSTGDVISNDGETIVEERSFVYKENLVFDSVSVGLELTEAQVWGISALVGGIADVFGAGGGATAATLGALKTVNGQQWEVPPEALRALSKLDELAGLGGVLDVTKTLSLIMPQPEFAMLDGKKVRLTITDGKGFVKVEPIGCELSEQEELVITRANALSDHYIFPHRAREVGQSWAVPADNLGSILDPRLRGVVINDDVRLKRTDDTPGEAGSIVRNVAIAQPQRIRIGSSGEGKEMTGELQLDDGRFELPDLHGVVTYIEATGSAEYRQRTTDHLLFEMELRARPTFRAFGRTTVMKR